MRKYKPSQLISVDEVLAEDLKDPEFRRLWEKTALARSIALLVLQYRTTHDMNQKELAAKLGLSPPALARLESGEHNPSFETIRRISNALDLEIAVDFAPVGKQRRLVAQPPPSDDDTRIDVKQGDISVIAS